MSKCIKERSLNVTQPAFESKDQRILTNSGAARALVTGVKLSVEGLTGRVGPLPKMKTSFFAHFTFEGPFGLRWALLSPRRAPKAKKIDPCGPDTGPAKHVNCLFLLNFDSERLQYFIVRIKNWPKDRRGGNFHPFHTPPPWLRYCVYVSWLWDVAMIANSRHLPSLS